MRIVVAYPPMIKEIDAKFHVRNKRVIYSWGDVIYNPMASNIRPELIKHEEVHGYSQRQTESVEEWWERYIASSSFRLKEEIPAHRAELEYLMEQALNRHAKRGALKHVAKRLAAPLYGRMTTTAEARRILRRESCRQM